MRIDQHTELYGVVGRPLGHSLSPVMHNAAFSSVGLNALYLAFESEDIAGCMKGVKAMGIKGMSVTIPFKSAVMSFLDDTDDLAKRIGAVNTVLNDGGRLVGYNTDGTGALKALERKTSLHGKSCLIVGAGGAARAIGFALKEQGVRLTVVNRSTVRGEDLARRLGCRFAPLKDADRLRGDLLIQTTPTGMYPKEEECIVPEVLLREGTTVMDIVYNPAETKLLRMARARNCRTVEGLDMFIHQGGEQFKIWTGMEPPMGAMTAAVEAESGKGS